MSDLEVDRARKQASVDVVLPLADTLGRLSAVGIGYPTPADVVEDVFGQHRIRSAVVPENFPLALADGLRKKGIGIEVQPDPFWPNREIKTRREVASISRSLDIAQEGMAAGRDALGRANITRDGALELDGAPLTSGRLKAIINSRIIEMGAVPSHTIVSSGVHSVDPHDEGSGPIQAHEPIIIDIFPRSVETGYFGDMTRTFVRGRASDALKRAYEAVGEAQDLGFRRIRPGADPAAIHGEILALFRDRGFETGKRDGRMVGFFHGTGHGLGLDIHEAPSFGLRSRSAFRPGHVVTVEPGLYYPGMGGVRLEDVVVVNRRGCRNLVNFPRELEIE
jgi:Xaa-Pro aminopeptidase